MAQLHFVCAVVLASREGRMSKTRKIILTAVTTGVVAGLLALGAGLASARSADQFGHAAETYNSPLHGLPVGSPLPPED
jgi:hypothetical protein